jgi:hypothetical protein
MSRNFSSIALRSAVTMITEKCGKKLRGRLKLSHSFEGLRKKRYWRAPAFLGLKPGSIEYTEGRAKTHTLI